MRKANVITGAVGLAVAMTAAANAQNAAPRTVASASSGAPPAFTSTNDVMQRSGGSLLQAAIPQAPADQQGKVSSYSATAVPEPEPHVYKKHDLIGIIVSEDQKSSSAGSTNMQKAVDFDAKTDAFVKFSAAKFSVLGGAEGANPPEIKLEGSRDYKGTGEVDRSDTITLRLEAEVVAVRPNGTMVVQARRHMKTDDEEVTVTLTGICRVQDIDAANGVLSTDIHDLDLNKQTKGHATDGSRPGFIPRLLDVLSPF